MAEIRIQPDYQDKPNNYALFDETLGEGALMVCSLATSEDDVVQPWVSFPGIDLHDRSMNDRSRIVALLATLIEVTKASEEIRQRNVE